MPTLRGWVTDFLNVLGGYFAGETPPTPPTPPAPPTPSAQNVGRVRMTTSLPLAYLAWLHTPIEWFEEWRRRVRSASPLPVVAFNHDADMQDVMELFA